MEKREIGIAGENAACAYLSKKGYLIENRNFRLNFGEIDIIAMDRDGCRVFVEVKTRKNQGYLPASAAVGKEKQRRILATAQQWITEQESCDQFSFDIIEVYTEDKTIRHIRNAFV